jgi:hypothetical protein
MLCSSILGDKSLRPTRSLFHVLAIVIAVLVFAMPPVIAQEAATGQTGYAETASIAGPESRPVRTDSPRDTLRTFLRLRDSLETALLGYRAERSVDRAELISHLLAQFRVLVDLSQVAPTSRRELGNDTHAYLLDIFGRVVMPNLDIVPDAEAFAEEEGLAQYRIPMTPIRITRIDEGPREGEFLFNARTVSVAPRLSPEQLERINDTLDYPPRGSPEAGREDLEAAVGAERLSAELSSGEEPDEQEENRGRRTER